MQGNKLTTFLKSFETSSPLCIPFVVSATVLLPSNPTEHIERVSLKMTDDSAKRCSQKSLIY